ncbi:MAG TPA: flagellar basal body-associated protein FliL [Noviherbaspirillum sp.]|nr:flagellar basal body-associated protein FliL [Noviherbaspirillum sp.]
MATAPKPVAKAAPKVVPIDEAAGAAAPKSNKKLFLIIGGAALLLGGAGGAWYFMNQKAEPGKPKEVAPAPPVFVTLEPFTVNLQSDDGERYLQVAFTLQVASQEQVDLIKLYMPLLRSRLLMLLASKKASDLSTDEGKRKLQEDIMAQAKLPFAPKGKPQEVNAVFFTSFVIQ